MELCSSYVGLSFILLCVLLMYVLMVCKLIFVVSRSCFMFVSSYCCRNISAIRPDIGDPMEMP